MAFRVDMSKLGAFAKIAIDEGHAGDTVAVMDKSGSISSGGIWHKGNIFRRLVRSGAEKAQNQATRQAFLDALGAAISEDGQHLGGRVALKRLKEMLGDDAGVLDGGFALDKDGNVTANKPLTERRISLIVDKLKEHAAEGSKTDTGPRLGIRNLMRCPENPPEMGVTESSENPEYERHQRNGSVGYKFAIVYANHLAKSLPEWMNKGPDVVLGQTVKDVNRDGKIRFGNTVLERASFKGADEQKKIEIVGEAFRNHFGKDQDFAYLLASISNQTLFNGGTFSLQTYDNLNGDFINAPAFIPKGDGTQTIQIGDIKDGKVSITASRSTTPVFFTPNLKEMAEPLSVLNGSREETFVINITKLGKRDKAKGYNVVQVGDSHFRIEVDPVESTINEWGDVKKK